MTLLHGTCVAVDGTGVVLTGPPGAGKSDLALRLMDGGADLVADDQIVVEAGPRGVVATAPDSLRGMIEVRGLGILRVRTTESAVVALVVKLADQPLERLPTPSHTCIMGVPLPEIGVSAFEASAVARVRLALSALAGEGSVAGALGDQSS